MRISDWSSDVCSSDLFGAHFGFPARAAIFRAHRVDVTIQRADGEQFAVDRGAAGILGVLALLVAPAEPAMGLGTLRPQGLAAGGINRSQLAVGAVGIEQDRKSAV